MRLTLSLLFLLLFATVSQAGEKITYSIDGQAYEGYFIKAKPEAPMILLVHDWDGLNGYEMKRTQLLADLGYSVFAVDLFGEGVRPTTLEDKKKLTGELYNDRTKMRKLLTGALDTAKAHGLNTGKAVAIGYCFGGGAVLELARSGADLKGFVSFHGGLATPDGQNYATAKGKYLILHGSADTAVTLHVFAGLAKGLEENHVEHEMISYSGAPHAFTVFGSPAYREDADKKSWQRFKEFLKETL